MSEPVTLPLWSLLLLAALAAWSAADRIFLPGLRWVLRRRVERAVEDVNARLSIRLQPFKLTKRQVLLDRLVYDPQVMEALDAHARERGEPREVAFARVQRYAREIVPAFNAYVYFRLGYRLARAVARRLYRVRLGTSDEAALAAVPPEAAVVFVMNHRSNMDYILVSYLVAERAALSYAVGEWARIWPLGQLIRAMGAYFVRRGSGDPLYRRVLERYVAMATAAGVTQAVFPEGGLSRDGALRAPRLGLLDYMLRDFDPQGSRDVVFVPVALNYDRVLEDRTLLLDLVEAAERRPAPALSTTLRFLLRNLGLMAKSEWHRFGYACVNFGRPVSAREFFAERGTAPGRLAREERFAEIGLLAARLMEEIGRALPALPVPLVATIFLAARGEPLSELEVKARSLELLRRLAAAGAQVYIPRRDQDYAVAVGLRMLRLRRLVVEEEGLLRARPGEERLLAYYANSIGHLLPAGDEAAPAGANPVE